MNIDQIKDTLAALRQIVTNRALLSSPIHVVTVVSLRDSLSAIATDISATDSVMAHKLDVAKTQLFIATQNSQTYVNPVALGEAIFCLEYLEAKAPYNDGDIWSFIHPSIQKSSKKLYKDGHYANAAEDAFIEINDRVKKLFSIVKPSDPIPDGEAAMTTVFSSNNPLVEFSDRSTTTGQNKQKGYMQMLAGAMSALRNPKAHSNTEIVSAEEAYRRLATASMLMYAIDEAVVHSGINE